MNTLRLHAVCLSLMLCASPLHAQTTMPPAAQRADLFDFWVGDWTATWTNADGTAGSGRNHITKVLDGKVLEENFDELVGQAPMLKGRSLSVQQATGEWKQAWADNQGGYYSFTGQADGDKRIFITDVVMKDGKPTAQRMVFHDIHADAFIWDWESTADGGKTWKRVWRIDYKRR